jgi:hypothetical protein
MIVSCLGLPEAFVSIIATPDWCDGLSAYLVIRKSVEHSLSFYAYKYSLV